MELDWSSPGVAYAKGGIVRAARKDMAALEAEAAEKGLGRIRICAHPGAADALHEMLIVIRQGNYVRPHKHLRKSESFHILEGEADVVVFDDGGGIRQVVPMGAYASSRNFYYRLNEPAFHTVLTRSERLVFHETTNGPFVPGETVPAPWAPAEADPGAGAYLAEVAARAVEWLRDAGL